MENSEIEKTTASVTSAASVANTTNAANEDKQILSNAQSRKLALIIYMLEQQKGASMQDILNALRKLYDKCSADNELECSPAKKQENACTSNSVQEDSIKKKIRRDIDEIASWGYSITSDNNGIYQFDWEKAAALPLDFKSTLEEEDLACLVRAMCASFLQDDSYAYKEDLKNALVRLANALDIPDTLLPMLQQNPKEAKKKPQKTKHRALMIKMGKIRNALDKKQALSISYTKNCDELQKERQQSRRICPLSLFTYNKQVYLFAFDEEKNSARIFRLDRIQKIKLLGEKEYAAISASSKEQFGEALFDVEHDRYPCLSFQLQNDTFDVCVCFEKNVAEMIPTLRLGGGTFEKQEDGNIIWNTKASNAKALARWCIETGPGIYPLSPASVCTCFNEILENTKAAYEKLAAKLADNAGSTNM